MIPPSPGSIRLKLLAACAVVVLAVTAVTSVASADDKLRHKQRHVHRAIGAAQGDLEHSSKALRTATSRLRASRDGLALDPSDPLPVPDSIRDAVLLRVQSLSPEARAALDVASVAGPRFDLDMAADLSGADAGLDELIRREILIEAEPGTGAFRQSLVREAVYADIPRGRRRPGSRPECRHPPASSGCPSPLHSKPAHKGSEGTAGSPPAGSSPQATRAP